MGLYRRDRSPIWWMSFTFEGRSFRRSTGTEDKKLASSILAKVKTQIIEGKWFGVSTKEEAEAYSFSQLAEKYSKWIQGRQKSEAVKKYILKGLVSRFGGTELPEFNTLLIEEFQSELIAKGYKNAYINKTLGCLKAMFTKAVEWDMVEEPVLRKVRKVKALRENKRLRYLSPDECRKLVKCCDAHLKPIVVTALATGLRKGNILGLKWSALDLKNNLILIESTKNGERLEVPINGMLRTVFLSLPRRLDGGYVFSDPRTGKPYGELKHSFSSACRRAGIKDFHFHDLRHTFAGQMIMTGADLTTVKELLGHKDIKMTLRYAHLAPSHKVKAMEVYDKALNLVDDYSIGKIEKEGSR